MKQRKIYYSRKNKKIIIEEKLTRYNKPYNKYLATLPEPEVMLNLIKYVRNNPDLKHLFKKRKKDCGKCGKLALLKNGLCLNCRKLVEDPNYKEKEKIQKKFNISYELYKKLTKSCAICYFKNSIEIHHINKNHNDNREENLIGLCANHHRMIHTKKHEKEMMEMLEKNRNKIVKINEEKEQE